MEKILIKGVSCCHGNPVFDAMFTQILAFSEFSPLINEISKTRANC